MVWWKKYINLIGRWLLDWRIEIVKNCLFYYFFVGVYMCVWFMEDFDENEC